MPRGGKQGGAAAYRFCRQEEEQKLLILQVLLPTPLPRLLSLAHCQRAGLRSTMALAISTSITKLTGLRVGIGQQDWRQCQLQSQRLQNQRQSQLLIWQLSQRLR
jgi:hypothetical protein